MTKEQSMRPNPVAKNARKANRGGAHATPKDYRRTPKHPKRTTS